MVGEEWPKPSIPLLSTQHGNILFRVVPDRHQSPLLLRAAHSARQGKFASIDYNNVRKDRTTEWSKMRPNVPKSAQICTIQSRTGRGVSWHLGYGVPWRLWRCVGQRRMELLVDWHLLHELRVRECSPAERDKVGSARVFFLKKGEILHPWVEQGQRDDLIHLVPACTVEAGMTEEYTPSGAAVYWWKDFAVLLSFGARRPAEILTWPGVQRGVCELEVRKISCFVISRFEGFRAWGLRILNN